MRKLILIVSTILFSHCLFADVGDNVFHLDLLASTKHITVDESSARVFIPDTAANRLRIVDLANLQELPSIDFSVPVYDIAVSESLGRVFVTLGGSGVVAVFDIHTLERLPDIFLPEAGYEIVTDDQFLYISAYGSYNGIMRVDLGTELYIDTFKGSLFTYYRAMLALAPDNSRLYVANVGLSPLSLGVFDLTGETPSLVLTHAHGALGSNGGSLSVDPLNGNYVSVAAGGGNTSGYDTYVLNTGDLSVISQLNTEAYPRAVLYSQDGQSVYTAHASGSILKWGAETATLIENLAISGQAQVMVEAYNSSYLIVGTQSNSIDIYEIGDPPPPVPRLNTVTNGLQIQQVVCYNKSTRQRVKFWGDGSNYSDCVANGMQISVGDRVRITVHGTVE